MAKKITDSESDAHSLNRNNVLEIQTKNLVYDRQAEWGRAVHLGSQGLVLAFGLGAAVAGALSLALAGSEGLVLAVCRGLALGLPVVAACLALFLGWWDPARRWIAYRSGAESLKAELFQHAARVGPYQHPDRDAILARRRVAIDAMVQAMLHPDAKDSGS